MASSSKFESTVDYTTKLSNFEGPLDLLLHLIKQAEIDIKDIFVSEVTSQFLEYVSNSDIDMETESEYLSMAATIIEIKAKAIIPNEEAILEAEEEGNLLIQKLEEYKLLKESAEKLKERENTDRFYKEPDKSIGETKIVYNEFNLDSLVKAFFKLMMRVEEKRKSEVESREIPKEVFSVKDKVDYIRSVLLDRGFVSFFELFSMNVSRNELITTFQATLELLKLQYIKVEQKDLFGDITLLLREDRNEEIGEIDEYN